MESRPETVPPAPQLTLTGVCIDCADAAQLAGFYSELLGWDITAQDGDWYQLRNPHGGVGLNIQGEQWYQPPTWPEEMDAQHKMLHFEIAVDDLEAAVAHATAAGAREAPHQPSDRDPSRIRILLDPAGHPFCLFAEGE